MVRKIFKTGNSLVVSLPKESLKLMGLAEGSEITITVNEGHNQIIIEPAQPQIPGVDAEFVQQVNAFIEQYQSALDALAK